MTDWSGVRRDTNGDWKAVSGKVPLLVFAVNRRSGLADWTQAAEFCQAVADTLQAKAEAEELARETELKLKVARICSEAHLMHHPEEAIIRAVREHDA